jgi:hypothetical protein
MFPLSCFLVEDSKSKSSSWWSWITTTRVSSGWEASISIRFDIREVLREPVAWPPAHLRRGELASVIGERGDRADAATDRGCRN